MISSLCLALAASGGTNLYWPGHFEGHLFGGCFSNQNRVVLEPEPGRAANRVWVVGSGYQHLELLVPGYNRVQVDFRAKTAADQTVVLKVISPPLPGGTDLQERATPVALAAGGGWGRHSVIVQTGDPYPGPAITELLVTCYNPGPDPFLLDDLAVRVLDPEPVPALGRRLLKLPDASGEWRDSTGGPGKGSLTLRLGSPSESFTHALPAGLLSGRRIVIRAGAALAGSAMPIQPWAGLLLVLEDDRGPIRGKPDPLWLPAGLALPPGQFRTISAAFSVPQNPTGLRLRLLAQPGLGANAVMARSVEMFEDAEKPNP